MFTNQIGLLYPAWQYERYLATRNIINKIGLLSENHYKLVKFMNIIKLLVSKSWLTLILAILMGAASGGGSTLLLAQINQGINSDNSPTSQLLIVLLA